LPVPAGTHISLSPPINVQPRAPYRVWRPLPARLPRPASPGKPAPPGGWSAYPAGNGPRATAARRPVPGEFSGGAASGNRGIASCSPP
jgi:hypothetical protein